MVTALCTRNKTVTNVIRGADAVILGVILRTRDMPFKFVCLIRVLLPSTLKWSVELINHDVHCKAFRSCRLVPVQMQNI